MKRDSQYYLLMLEYLLQEMMNLEESELKYAPKLAYIFHNVPSLLLYDLNEQSAEQAYNDMLGRASALGLKAWLDTCEQVVASKISYTTGESGDRTPSK
jgi:hypothetical protein